jgi:hypothetical protein
VPLWPEAVLKSTAREIWIVPITLSLHPLPSKGEGLLKRTAPIFLTSREKDFFYRAIPIFGWCQIIRDSYILKNPSPLTGEGAGEGEKNITSIPAKGPSFSAE